MRVFAKGDYMSDFNKMQKQYCWPKIEEAMNARIGKEKTAELFSEAISLSRQYEEKYVDMKGFQKRHASAAYNIAALYIPLKKAIGSKNAINVLDEAWKPAALQSNARYDRLPPRLFIELCRIIACTAFGNGAGFERRDISRDAKEVRFDVLFCPYVRIMTELGCAEACPVVCRQDEYTYGGMRGVLFERTKTLGRGDEKCDFCYRLKEKEKQ